MVGGFVNHWLWLDYMHDKRSGLVESQAVWLLSNWAWLCSMFIVYAYEQQHFLVDDNDWIAGKSAMRSLCPMNFCAGLIVFPFNEQLAAVQLKMLFSLTHSCRFRHLFLSIFAFILISWRKSRKKHTQKIAKFSFKFISTFSKWFDWSEY